MKHTTTRSHRAEVTAMKRTTTRIHRPVTLLAILSVCLGFLAAMGFWGGLLLLQRPTGELLGYQLAWLKGTIFSDYLFPGLWLLLVFGVGGAVILYGLWARPQWESLVELTRWTREFWAWDLTIVIGVLLLIWQAIQMSIIPDVAPIQLIMAIVGGVLVVLPFVPAVRKYYHV